MPGRQAPDVGASRQALTLLAGYSSGKGYTLMAARFPPEQQRAVASWKERWRFAAVPAPPPGPQLSAAALDFEGGLSTDPALPRACSGRRPVLVGSCASLLAPLCPPAAGSSRPPAAPCRARP